MNRESIVFYKDWWEAIQCLPEEKRLEAIAAVMDYAFAGVEPEDSMLRFATSQFRVFIDRDTKRYEDICKKRKENARRGGLAKAAKSKQVQPNDAYNDNDNDNDNDNEKNKDKSLSSLVNNSAQAKTCDDYDDGDLLSRFFAPDNKATLETLAMQLQMTVDQMQATAKEIVDEWKLTERTQHTTYNDASRHLISTLRKRKQWGKPTDAAKPKEPGLGVGEYRNAKGQRTYNGSTVVPESAPPRPSAGHWWSAASNAWCNQI